MSFCPMIETPKITKEKKPNRLTMPHVITQWKPAQSPRDGVNVKEQSRADKKSAKSFKSTKNQNLGADGASLSGSSITTTPKSKRWDFGSIRHRRQPSSEAAVTPSSACDPVFEMEHIDSSESPNSSTHSSSWVFELEDTSRIALHSKRSAFPGSQLEFQSSAITSRSVIKVIDQTIAAIEADNRKLLSRAIAAESTVKALREHNFNLQLRVDHCEKTHHRRPRAVASQPMLRSSHQKSTTPTSATQLTAVDQLVKQLPPPTGLRKASTVKPASASSYSPASSHPPYSPARNIPNKPLPLTPTRPRRPTESSQRNPHSHAQFSPVQPPFAPQSTPQFSPVRSPLQFSPVRSPASPRGRKLRGIPMQPKPLTSTPLSPLSPHHASSLNGKVEIGLGIGPQQYQELEGELASSEREFYHGMV